MAYQSKNLSVLAYANGFTLWHYKTADGIATVSMDGYFNDTADIICAGDIILATTEAGGMAKANMIFVTRNDPVSVSGLVSTRLMV